MNGLKKFCGYLFEVVKRESKKQKVRPVVPVVKDELYYDRIRDSVKPCPVKEDHYYIN